MIKITSAKISKERMLTVGSIDTDDTTKHKKDAPGVKCDWIAHDDLVNAFKPLAAHLAFMLNLPEVIGMSIEDYLPDGDRAPRFEITTITPTGFVISGEDDSEGVVLIGSRDLPSGKVQNLLTPFWKWEDQQPYEYMSELGEAIYALQNETLLYYQGKAAPKRQLEMFEDNLGPDDHQEPVPVEAKVKQIKKNKIDKAS